jgi:hypothetical protein
MWRSLWNERLSADEPGRRLRLGRLAHHCKQDLAGQIA